MHSLTAVIKERDRAADPAVAGLLSYLMNPQPPVIHGGATEQEESQGSTLGQAGFQAAYPLRTWEAESAAVARQIITESAFLAGGHYVIQCQYLSKRARKQL